MKKIILASQSPRRAEILKKAEYVFVSFPVSISEIPNKNLSLDEQILDIARRKAIAASDLLTVDHSTKVTHFFKSIILASDTMVCFENQAIGKPENDEDAFQTLKKLSAKTHFVKTAIILIDLETKKEFSHIETSFVTFKKLSDADIADYISTREHEDKAGSYAIQGIGQKLVEKFEGDYDNIVGLPLKSLEDLLNKNDLQCAKAKDVQSIVHKDQFNKIRNETQKFNAQLLAVSKLQHIEKIIALNSLGQIHFGENYVQEALEKINLLKTYNLKWHLIGPLQKNKVKFLKNNFEYIHSVDSLELLQLINHKAAEINYIQKVFIQVNLSHEATKSGFDDVTVVEFLKKYPQLQLANIHVVGLMTMPPLQNEAHENEIYFKKLYALATEFNLKELSMGTSHDYLIALEEHATWIRIGTDLFGERE